MVKSKVKLSSLSIFFPAFNEEKNIAATIKKALVIAPTIASKFEILVIDDGSKDKTAEVVGNIAKKEKTVKLIKHPKNLGYGAALKTGFYNSSFDYIAYMDSDGQYDFSDIVKMIEKIQDADVVAGFRVKRADSFNRIVYAKLWNLLLKALFGISVRDIDCGFKLIKRQVLGAIPHLKSNGATISAELLTKAKKKGFKIDQVGLVHKPRVFGVNTHGDPLHIFRAFYDLVTLLSKI